MAARSYYDAAGRPVALGRQLGVGGEGAVFEIPASPASVAKVYHKPLPKDHQAKLQAMAALARPEVLRVAAWPTATLHDGRPGAVVGVVMPKVAGHKEVHHLYSPASRKKEFPQADWAFLAHAGANCARAFESIHRAGHVIGDVNQSNVLVSPQATVALIDCDSYQVQANGRRFLCGVGVDLYTPPELQGRSLRGLERTPNHDRFGLAVLVFHLIFVGRHPFSGRFLGRGDMPLERAIAEYRFAFGSRASAKGMAPPPHSLTLGSTSPALAALFERAFDDRSSQPDARPTPAEWITALEAFKAELRPCAAEPGHKYPGRLGRCVWCELSRQGAPNFFVSVAVYQAGPAGAVPTFAAAVGLWAAIEQIPPPPRDYRRPAPPRSALVPTVLPAGLPRDIPPKVVVRAGDLQQVFGWTAIGTVCVFVLGLCVAWPMSAFGLIAFLAFGGYWLVLEAGRRRDQRNRNAGRRAALDALDDEIRSRKERYRRSLRALEDAEVRWRHATQARHAAFAERKRQLHALRSQHAGLKAAYDAEHEQLRRNCRASQLSQYLQQHLLSDHKIPNIGPTLLTVLRSFGIETADDLDDKRVDEVPGFGEKRTGYLLAWRRQVEAGFKFNPVAGVPAAHLYPINLKYTQMEQHLEAGLRNGAEELREIAAAANQELSALMRQIQQLVAEAASAEVDLSVVPR
jgi:DNA-binding helix-hairpin-helix protein with protein kinase domain